MIKVIIIAFLASAALAAFMIPMIIGIAFKNRLFDKTNSRKIHHGHIPRLGGVAFFFAAVLVLTLTGGFALLAGDETLLNLFEPHAVKLVFGLGAIAILFGFGLVDDLKGLRYRSKFMGQLAAGLLLCLSGLWISDVHGIFGLHQIPEWLGYAVTIFAILYLTNAINFIDGIDGLSGSICALSLVYYIVVFLNMGRYDYVLLAAVFLGPLIPFLGFNIFGKAKRRTKIFMGDTGSMILGFVLGALGIGLNQTVDDSTPFNAMALAFAPMVLPCFDVIRVVFSRLHHHCSPFKADQRHIHHKFLQMGLSQHQTLLAVLLLTVLMGALSVWLTAYINVNAVLGIDLLLTLAFSMLTNRKIKKIKNNKQ